MNTPLCNGFGISLICHPPCREQPSSTIFHVAFEIKSDTGTIFHEIYGIWYAGEIHIFAYNRAQTYVRLKCWGTRVHASYETVPSATEVRPGGRTADGNQAGSQPPARWLGLSLVEVVFKFARLRVQLDQSEMSQISQTCFGNKFKKQVKLSRRSVEMLPHPGVALFQNPPSMTSETSVHRACAQTQRHYSFVEFCARKKTFFFSFLHI